MISESTLNRAVSDGIISLEQRLALERLESEPLAEASKEHAVNDENLRLVGGGNDLFVTVGIGLLFSGLIFALQSFEALDDKLLIAGLAAAFWAVAEIVTRQHRMKLSSTVLGLGFVTCIGLLLGQHVYGQLDLGKLEDNAMAVFGLRGEMDWLGSLFTGGIAITAAIYFYRFRVPIMAAVIALSVTALAFLWASILFYDGIVSGQVLMPTAEQVPLILERALLVPLFCGFLVFGTAVVLDLHDRERFTVWSDCAFWLHVVSAPLLVHPLFTLATGQDVVLGRIEPDQTASIMLGLLILSFVYVALAIDRRSLLVPTLAYFGSLGVYYMIDSTANQTGIPPFALILLLIGALVIMFGAGWQRIRSLIVGSTLPRSWLNKLPPIKV